MQRAVAPRASPFGLLLLRKLTCQRSGWSLLSRLVLRIYEGSRGGEGAPLETTALLKPSKARPHLSRTLGGALKPPPSRNRRPYRPWHHDLLHLDALRVSLMDLKDLLLHSLRGRAPEIASLGDACAGPALRSPGGLEVWHTASPRTARARRSGLEH